MKGAQIAKLGVDSVLTSIGRELYAHSGALEGQTRITRWSWEVQEVSRPRWWRNPIGVLAVIALVTALSCWYTFSRYDLSAQLVVGMGLGAAVAVANVLLLRHHIRRAFDQHALDYLRKRPRASEFQWQVVVILVVVLPVLGALLPREGRWGLVIGGSLTSMWLYADLRLLWRRAWELYRAAHPEQYGQA